jgi:hypothetical protein
MTINREKMFFKRGYELRNISEEEAENIGLNEQVYCKINGVAYPHKIVKCYENANKFDVEIIK